MTNILKNPDTMNCITDFIFNTKRRIWPENPNTLKPSQNIFYFIFFLNLQLQTVLTLGRPGGVDTTPPGVFPL